MNKDNFKIAGISFYNDNIMNHLAFENYDYSRPKSELQEFYDVDQRIYKYNFEDTNVSLVPEPDNPHDPNAIRVEVSGILIGYIKSGSCSRVRNLVNSPDFNKMEIKIGGGEYKCLWEDENGKIQMEKGSTELNAVLTIYTGQEDEPKSLPPEPQKPQKNISFFVILIILGVLLFIVGISRIGTDTITGIIQLLIAAAFIGFGVWRMRK